MVAVLYSPAYGAGWYTWNTEHEGLIFDQDIVEAILYGNTDKAVEIATQRYDGAYLGGADDLAVCWLPIGTRFRIDEYDGYESVVLLDREQYLIA